MSRMETTQYPLKLESLPRNWVAVCIGDLIPEIQPGFACGAHNRDGIGVSHLRPMNIDRQGRLDLSVVKYVSPDNGLRIQRGDVLFNNTNSPELVGKTTHIDADAEFAFSNHMTRLRPPDGVNPKFLAYQLHYLWMTGYFRHLCVKHVNQASVSSETLANKVPAIMPPSKEQIRIVAEIEKQFTRLEAAIAALQRVQANLKRYRAAVLKAACEGRLVPTEAELARAGGRTYEPADQLLTRILTGRQTRWEADQLAKFRASGKLPKDDKWKAKCKEPFEPEVNDLPSLPEGWCWISLDFLVHSIEAGKNFKCEERSPQTHEVGVVKVSAVTWGEFDESETKTCLDPSRVSEKHIIRPGDFLFSRANTIELVGACVIVKDVRGRHMLSDKILRLNLLTIPTTWVLYSLRSAVGRNDIQRLSTGNQESMRNIGQDRIKQIRIPLPPLSEMGRISAEVERRLSVIDELEMQVEANLKRGERLRQAILKRAFEGKLVPQNSDDEPASVLLESIRAERAQRVAEAGRAKKRTGKQARVSVPKQQDQ